MKSMFAALLLLLGCAGTALAQTATATPTPGPPQHAVVNCPYTKLYTFANGSDRPNESNAPPARQGQTFDVLSGPRATLTGDLFYETNISVTETGPSLSPHYWIGLRCVNISVT